MAKANVLLLNSSSFNKIKYLKEERCTSRADPYFFPPVTLGLVSSLLETDGIKTRVVDGILENYTEEYVKNTINATKPDVVAVNSSTVTIYDDYKTCEIIKELSSDIKVVLFGPHVTALPHEALNTRAVDFVVRREPELILHGLIKALDLGEGYTDISGISYIKENRIFDNPDGGFIQNPDQLPFPDRSKWDNSRYTVPTTGEKFTIIRTTRGCPFNCIFCNAHMFYGRGHRKRSVENIISELKECVDVHGIKNFLMWSDTFTLDKRFVSELCTQIKAEKLDLKWFCNSRVDTVDKKMLKAMRDAGCWLISFGVESGNQRILDNAKKGITLSQSKKAIRLCNELGIDTYAYFIFGLPGETMKTMGESIRFALKLNSTYFWSSVATPLPGTEFYRMCEGNKWLKSRDWSKYDPGICDVIQYPNISSEDFLRYKKKAYLKLYTNPRVLYNIVRSNKYQNTPNLLKAGVQFLKTWIHS